MDVIEKIILRNNLKGNIFWRRQLVKTRWMENVGRSKSTTRVVLVPLTSKNTKERNGSEFVDIDESRWRKMTNDNEKNRNKFIYNDNRKGKHWFCCYFLVARALILLLFDLDLGLLNLLWKLNVRAFLTFGRAKISTSILDRAF